MTSRHPIGSRLLATTRRFVKQTTLAVLYGLRVFDLGRFLHRHQLLILTYHGILTDDARNDDYLDRNFVDASEFRRQLRYLTRYYNVVPLETIVEIVRDRRPVPKHTVAITFDDGFRNNYTVAYPILREFHCPFTIFLTTGFIGGSDAMLWTEELRRAIYRTARPAISLRVGAATLEYSTKNADEREHASREIVARLKSEPDAVRQESIRDLKRALQSLDGDPEARAERYEFLGWDEVREMAHDGVGFGSHTVTHPIISTLEDAEATAEIAESRATIESALQRECGLFAYPNGERGDFGERDKALLQRAGYSCAVTQLGGFNTTETDPFELRRMNVGRGHGFLAFVAMTSGALALFRKTITIGRNRPRRSTGSRDPGPMEV